MLSQFPLIFPLPHFHYHADWYGFRDQNRDAPWDDKFNPGIFAAASEFWGWFRLELICLIESIRANLICLHDFQQLVLL